MAVSRQDDRLSLVAFVEFEHRPELSRPILMCAFRGWNDGGEAATTAASHLREQWHARAFAHVDPEEFFDFQVTRPTVRLEDGLTRRLDWPPNDFFHAPALGRDIVLFIGIEPNVRWRTFCGAILWTAEELGIELLVTLGAFLADVPHTRPAPVSGSSTDPELTRRLGVSPSQYEGPTGIVGVLHDAARQAALPSVSLWAAAPHYLPAATNPKVAIALLEKLHDLLEIDIDMGPLREAASAWESQVDEAVGADPNLAAYVRRLEEAAAERQEFGEIPSGESLAAELERFLRDQGEDGASS